MKKGNKCPRFCNQDHIDTAICLALSDRQIFQQQKNIVLYLLKGQKCSGNTSSPFDYFKMIWKRVPLETSFLKFGILFRIWKSPYYHPFILRPRFLQFLEIWFKKPGWRNLFREI